MAFNVELKNSAKFQAEMSKKKNFLGKRRKVNAAALTVVDRWVQDNFKTEGGKIGGWQPLKPATLRQRRGGGGKVMILQDTGQLRQRWKHILQGFKTAILQSGVSYGIYHDQGTKRLPKRQILPEQKEINPALKKVYEFFIRKAIK